MTRTKFNKETSNCQEELHKLVSRYQSLEAEYKTAKDKLSAYFYFLRKEGYTLREIVNLISPLKGYTRQWISFIINREKRKDGDKS